MPQPTNRPRLVFRYYGVNVVNVTYLILSGALHRLYFVDAITHNPRLQLGRRHSMGGLSC